jgi:hypothetical protein
MANNMSIWSRGWHEDVPTDLDLASVEIVPDTIDAIVFIEKDVSGAAQRNPQMLIPGIQAMYQRLFAIMSSRVLLMTVGSIRPNGLCCGSIYFRVAAVRILAFATF